MATILSSVSVPSQDRVEPGSVNIRLGEFPASASSSTVDACSIAADLISTLNRELANRDYHGIANLFLRDGYWRDHLALSWDLRTLKGRSDILAFLDKNCPLQTVRLDTSSAFRAPVFGPIDGWGDVKGVQFFITFDTNIGNGQGVVRLAEEDGQWRIFTFFTSLRELKGYEEPVNNRRTKGVEHGMHSDGKNWADRRRAEANFKDNDPAVIIIGAGQGGLTAAARLKMLGVDALIVDSEVRIGDNWRQRYHQLVLHDPVWYDHMPYVNFPPHWPIFTPKDKLAEFLELYAKLLELNVWTETNLSSSSWDEGKRGWTVTLNRRKEDGSTETRTLHPRHIIQATGHSGKINFPSIPGLESFAGDRLCHSSSFPGATPNSRGKKAVVIGCCNSGHDIAQDFYENGYGVTMVQRSSTCVVSSESTTDIGLKGLYDENGPSVDDADLWLFAFPSSLFKAQQVKLTAVQNAHDWATLDGLKAAGFALDNGPNDAGLLMKYFHRGGGYYIDVGASRLIIDGKIRIKQGQEIKKILPNGLEFVGGDKLDADEIVFATGYQNMRTQTQVIFGEDIASRVGDVWGFDDEGEMRTIWRRSGHPGFWFMGGNLALCRYYSRILALQIKAIEEGIVPY